MLSQFTKTLLLTCFLTACAVGPDYVKPAIDIPESFKEGTGWKIAEPKDLETRGEWWEIFCDSELNRLQSLLIVDNQNIKVAEARYRQAQALVSQARSSFFPLVSANASSTRDSSTTRSTGNNYNAALNVAWELDIWGRIRRSVEANEAYAAASEADVAAAKLSAQAELAINYLSLRVADEQMRFLNATVEAYRKSLELTENLYNAGIQTRSDYLQAKVQLESARAQALDVGVQRSAYQHAIAVLIGQPPSEFTLPTSHSIPNVPKPPVSQPSIMLERRPDIAAAERRTAAANAQIGVAQAAYFPDLTLSASGGYASNALGNWFSAPARVWSIGPTIAATLFDAGLRRAQTSEAIAAYDETVATYRQTVLGAFQEVEDNLSALTILQQEQTIRDTAYSDAMAATEVITNQYKEGITSYLNVANAQTVQLNNALSALTVERQRLVASVNLIKALGGRWALPKGEPVKAEEFNIPEQAIPKPVPQLSDEKAVKLSPPKALLSSP